MRKIIVILLLLPLCLKAQIDIRQDNIRTVPVNKPVIYDSLQQFTVKPFADFNGTNQEKLDAYKNQFKQYIGQDIYFIPNYRKQDSLINLNTITHQLDFKFYYPNKYKKFIIGKRTEQIQEVKKNKLGMTTGVVTKFVEHDIIDSTNLYKALFLGQPTWDYYTINELKGKYYFTPYSAYLGQYFKIINFSFDETKYNIVMLDNNNDTVIYSPGYWDFPKFILLGYYTKMKEIYVGNDYIYSHSWNREIKTNDINSGEQITLKHESEWHCSSLEFLDLNNGKELQLYLILSNKDGNYIKIRLDNYEKEFEPLMISEFKEKQEYMKQKELERIQKEEKERLLAEAKIQQEKERLEFERRQNEERERLLAETKKQQEKERLEFEKMIKNKYGEYYGNLIIKQQVVIGMSDEMCRYAWGEPLRINTTIVEGLKSEQWVYSLYSYLYFDNGILTAIQN